MLKVFNVSALTQKQRFGKAVLFGSLTSLGLALVYIIINRTLAIEFFYVYLAIGYLIGFSVMKSGRGVQLKFSILAAVLCFLTILLGDLLTNYPHAFNAPERLGYLLLSLFSSYGDISFDSLLSIGFRVAAVGLAWQKARVV